LVDQRVEKLAKLCVDYSVEVKPKEIVVIQGSDAAFLLMNELYRDCLLAGAHPYVMANMDVQYTFYTHAKEHQLKFVSPMDKFIVENMDVNIGIFCEPNPKRLTNVDAGKMRMRTAARKELGEIFFKRWGDGKLRWVGAPFPITSQAQEAGMALPEYEDFVYGSCLLDKRDPAAEWRRIHKEQDRICRFLNKKSEIRVVGEDTDLTFSTKGRTWINCSGKVNMPDGEVYTGPVEDSVNGTIRFTYPGLYMGKEVEDIKLTFKGGKVIRASAAKGEDLLKELLKIEGANHLGETAIGTNYAIKTFTKDMLFDEKMGGTIHMALGRGIPESGSVNQSAIHWDILKDMKRDAEIYADGKIFFKNGNFVGFPA